MSLDLNGKTITDPLYGNIKLTELESELVSTPAFQRLHNVKQLGLGHLVFPSAAYSRFSHSVGACANADRILTAIECNHATRRFDDVERQAFRIAALFHDLGHYPFSHTTEHAVKRYHREGLYKSSDTADGQGTFDIVESKGEEEVPTFLDHEDTGKLIFLEDADIATAFARQELVSKSDVQAIYLDEGLSTIVSSDLDCDRMDYLKRTALHSGAPYGAVDVDFLISKSTIDASGRYCFDRKAMRAADHLLMSRFYDFMQIPYHKTVAALEWSLEEAVIYLLRTKTLSLTEANLRQMIGNGEWAFFDDGDLLNRLRVTLRNSEDSDDPVAMDHIRAVLLRKPAKRVHHWEALVEIGNNEQTSREQLLEMKVHDAAKWAGVERSRFTIWKAPFRLAKAGPILQRAPTDGSAYSDEEEQQLIQILGKGADSARPLIDLQNAVSHHLSKLKYQVLRVYYLPSPTDPPTLQEGLLERLQSQ